MKTHKNPALKKPAAEFLVLLPHRDCIKTFENFRQTLFAAGFCGAYSFPPVALLALLSDPLNIDEIRFFAGEIRNLSLKNEGKLKTTGCVQSGFPNNTLFEACAFYGPALDFTVAETLRVNKKVIHAFPVPLLCASVLGPDDTHIIEKISALNCAPILEPFSFRAAQLANLSIRQFYSGREANRNTAAYSYEWRFGSSCWLPAYKNGKKPK